jgi:hypothetical protein
MFQNIHERESCQKNKKKQGNKVFSQGTCPSGYRLSSEV